MRPDEQLDGVFDAKVSLENGLCERTAMPQKHVREYMEKQSSPYTETEKTASPASTRHPVTHITRITPSKVQVRL